MAAFYFDRNFPQRFSVWGAVLLSLGIGAFLTAMLDMVTYHRDVSIYLTELERHSQVVAQDFQTWMPWNYRQTPTTPPPTAL